MIVERSRRPLRMIALLVYFSLAFVAGCWQARDDGEAAGAIAAIGRVEQLAAQVDARIAKGTP